VREAAFLLAEKIGPAAVSGLTRLERDPDETVRWRAVEAGLAAGKEAAVVPVLTSLAPQPVKSEDVDSYIVHDLELIGPAAVPLLEQLLSRPRGTVSPVAMVAAIRGLGRLGKAPDVGSLKILVDDHTKIAGLSPATTFGQEARAAQSVLERKR
jgi:HEAT repeat protein